MEADLDKLAPIGPLTMNCDWPTIPAYKQTGPVTINRCWCRDAAPEARIAAVVQPNDIAAAT